MVSERALSDWRAFRAHEESVVNAAGQLVEALARGLTTVWEVQVDQGRAVEMLAVAGVLDTPVGYPDWPAYLAARLGLFSLLYGLVAGGDAALTALAGGDAATLGALIQQQLASLQAAWLAAQEPDPGLTAGVES